MMLANISQHHNKERSVPRDHVKDFVRVWRLLDGLSDGVEQLEVPEVLAIDNGDTMGVLCIGVDEVEEISSDSDADWDPMDEMDLLGEHLEMHQTKFRLHYKSPAVAPSNGNKKTYSQLNSRCCVTLSTTPNACLCIIESFPECMFV